MPQKTWGGYPAVQINSCAVLEEHQQDDCDAFIVISFNTIYPSSTCYTEGRTHSCSLSFSSISTVARAGGNPLRLTLAKSKQSLQPLLSTACCKLVPQELSTSLEGRFGQDDLQKFLPTSSPFWPPLGQPMPHFFCDKDSNHGSAQHPLCISQSDYLVRGRR